jgi:hypothetical protein
MVNRNAQDNAQNNTTKLVGLSMTVALLTLIGSIVLISLPPSLLLKFVSTRPAHAQNTPNVVQYWWSKVFAQKPPVKTRAGTARPARNICLAFPNLPYDPASKEGILKLWNRQPMLIWQGDAQEIKVSQVVNDKALEKPIATLDLSRDSKRIQPTIMFKAGQVYEWVAIPKRTKASGIRFQMVDESTAAAIEQDLAKLNQSLKAKRLDPSQLAIERARFFADRDLWLDAMQELYSVANPSEDIQTTIVGFEKEICKL